MTVACAPSALRRPRHHRGAFFPGAQAPRFPFLDGRMLAFKMPVEALSAGRCHSERPPLPVVPSAALRLCTVDRHPATPGPARHSALADWAPPGPAGTCASSPDSPGRGPGDRAPGGRGPPLADAATLKYRGLGASVIVGGARRKIMRAKAPVGPGRALSLCTPPRACSP